MKLRLNLSLRRALMAAMTAVCTLSSTATAGVVDGRYDLQYYLDFCRNKGMFSAGATNIEVFFKDGTSIEDIDSNADNSIALMPNMDSFGDAMSTLIGNKVGTNGGTNLVSSQFLYGAKHVHASVGNTPVAFLTENGIANCVYDSANLDTFGTDGAMQRLTKLVTAVAYTPLATDEFMKTVTTNGTRIFRIGNGGRWSEGKSISTGDNALGGVVNLSVCWQDSATGEWYLEGWARKSGQANDVLNPLEIGTYFGDSGSPCFAWDDENNQFVFVGANFAGGCQLVFPNWYLPRYNYQQSVAVMDKYTVGASFTGADTILWSASDSGSGKGTLTQGSATIVEYTGKGNSNTLADSLGLTFSTEDTTIERELQLQGNVNMGAGALTFENGKWKLTELADNNFTLHSAGFDIKKGAELTWELTGSSSQEIRKVGEGILTIAGSGSNESTLVVGGGTTVYDVTRDAEGNITGCTLGNAGETRLNRTGGYAAGSVRLEGGVAIIVLMGDEKDAGSQFKTNSTAGDTFSFGNAGGLLNLNGHDLSWGVINQYGSGKGARIGNFTPLGEAKPDTATFTYTGTGTFQGCFMDEGAEGAQLAVKYDNNGGTWKLTGNHTNAGGFTVQAGTMVLEGTNTPHVMMTDAHDWTYASMETSSVAVNSGATFQLSHHALLKGDVNVADGGAFILNQTTNVASESISGSLRQDMEQKGITSLIGNVTLNGAATMTVDTNSPVTTTMKGDIIAKTTSSGSTSSIPGPPSYDPPSASFIKKGSGTFVLDGNMGYVNGTVEAGGLVVTGTLDFDAGYNTIWTIGEQGFLAVKGTSADMVANYLKTSTGVLALTSNQSTAIDLSYNANLYIGAYGETPIEYGSTSASLAATYDSVTERNVWRLGGGTGTLNVLFQLTGDADLIIGNDYSSGTVHLANTDNDFSGDIYIKGTGNMLTYENGALGSAKVALTYGNTLALHDAGQLSILKDGAQGILALTQSMSLDLSGKVLSIGAVGDVTLTDNVTVSDDTYRFGGRGNLTVDTALTGATKMELDGQGNSGSSVTFARANAYSGSIVAGGGLKLAEANSAGDIGIHVGHAEALASVASMELQQGATLYTDGQNLKVNNLTAKSGSSIRNNGDTASLLQLNVDSDTETTIADGVLTNTSNNASLGLVKTGDGTLNMGANTSWSGGLTIMNGTVTGSIAAGGIGASGASIYVQNGASLQLTSGASNDCKLLASTLLQQKLSGDGEVSISNGNDMLFLNQSAGFTGQVKVTGNTRLYVTQNAAIDSNNSFSTSQAFDKATIVVESGSQARVTPSIFSLSTTTVNSWADYMIAGSAFEGGSSGLVQSQDDGALVVDCQATVWGNVTLADDAMIASWSYSPSANHQYASGYPYRCLNSPTDQYANRYGIINKLGGTIRGQILGEGKTLTIGGNEGMTITADSANTYGNLVINNGNGNNDDKFALRLNGGKAVSQTSTALGTGEVSLGSGLILRLAGTGTENQTDVEYTYANNITAGDNATLQGYNITNKLTGTVTMEGSSLNLATARGGVLELAGGISGSGTLNVAAASKVLLGAITSTAETPSFAISAGAGADITLNSANLIGGTTISGTDSLTLGLGGTEDYTLGGISLSASGEAGTQLSLIFDFSGAPDAGDESTWAMLNSDISADSTSVALSLNLFNDIRSGTYTLASGQLEGSYTLADDMNGRLALNKTDSGTLELTVGTDNRLYWTTDSESHNWNSTDRNWYQESSSNGNVAATEDSFVILGSRGIDEGNSAEARETISLTSDITVGTLAAKDTGACYEVTGEHNLSGDKLLVGNHGNLKLSTAAATFTEGAVVDNATLEVSGTTLTANVTAANNGNFYLSSNATLEGNLQVDGGTATISNATVKGNISMQGTGSATLSEMTLTREIVTAGGGRIMAATGYDGTSATYANATLSGTLGGGDATGSSLSLTSGSLYLDGAVQLDSLALGNGLTATIWNNTAISGADKKLGTIRMGNNSTLRSYDTNAPTVATQIGTIQLDGTSATVMDLYHSGFYTIHNVKGNADSTLNLVKNVTSNNVTVFTLGSQTETTEDGSQFGGIIQLKQQNANSDGNRDVVLVLEHESVAQKATINLASTTQSSPKLGLGVNVAEATIGGLESAQGLGNRAIVFSGTQKSNQGWLDMSASTNRNTLIINTQEGSSHDFYGQLQNVNLVKTGEGTQKLLGTSTNFTGSLSVQEGTLVLGSNSAIGTLAGLSVSNGATLDISGMDFSGSNAGIGLAANAAASINSGAIFAFGALADSTQYNIFNLGDGASLDGWNNDNLGLSNFTIDGISMSDMGRVSLVLGESGTFSYYTDRYDLVWNGGDSGTWNRDEATTPWLRTIGEETEETPTHFCNSDNVTFTGSTTATLGADILVSNMNIESGTVVIKDPGNYAFRANTATVTAGAHLQIWSETPAAGADNILTKLVLGKGATLSTNDRAVVTAATRIGTLLLESESATLQDVWNSGYFAVDKLTMGDGVTTSMLKLEKHATSSIASLFEFGSATAEAGNFKGEVELRGHATGGKRSAFIIISGNNALAGAHIDLAATNCTTAFLGLGINTTNATIAGLESGASLSTRAKLFSGTIGTQTEWYKESSTPDTVSDAVRTLTINTAKDADYTFCGEVVGSGKINLVKEGEGRQSFAGTGSLGTVTINGGTLALGGTMSITGTMSGEGTLAIMSSGVSLNSEGSAISTNLSVENGGTLSFGATDNLNYGIQRTIKVASGGKVDFGTTRQTMGGWTLELHGGEVEGTGQTIGETYYGAIDYHKAMAYVNALSGDSTISATTRLRGEVNNAGTRIGRGDITYNVAKDASLNVSGKVHTDKHHEGGIIKAGQGTLHLNNMDNDLDRIIVSSGTANIHGAASYTLAQLEAATKVEVGFFAGVTKDTTTKSQVTVSSSALLGGGATLNTSLTLSDGATLDMTDMGAGAVTLNGALTFGGKVTMGEHLLAIVNEMSGWQELTLFTGLTDAVLPGTVATTESGDVLASNVFTNVQDNDVYVSYRVIGNVGSLVVLHVPEPTTVTMSLLALTALAARRRRK